VLNFIIIRGKFACSVSYNNISLTVKINPKFFRNSLSDFHSLDASNL